MKFGRKVKLSLVGMDAKSCGDRQLFGAVVFAKYLHLAVLVRRNLFVLFFGNHLSRCEYVHIRGIISPVPSI